MVYERSDVPQPAEGFVYVMESAGIYKIGWAKRSPEKRRRDLQIGSAIPVNLVGAIEGSLAIEHEWHQAFKDKRLHGEWFALTEEDVARVLHYETGVDQLPGEFDVA